MTATATIAAPSERLQALERANEIRRARAQLKRRISAGHLTAAQVILDCPPEAQRWPLAALLACQRHWGSTTCRKFLAHSQISETKRIGELTERQRRLLAAELPQRSHNQANFPQPIGTAHAGGVLENCDVSVPDTLPNVAATRC